MPKGSRLPRKMRLTLASSVFREVDALSAAGHQWDEIVAHVASKYFHGDEERAEVWLAHRR